MQLSAKFYVLIAIVILLSVLALCTQTGSSVVSRYYGSVGFSLMPFVTRHPITSPYYTPPGPLTGSSTVRDPRVNYTNGFVPLREQDISPAGPSLVDGDSGGVFNI